MATVVRNGIKVPADDLGGGLLRPRSSSNVETMLEPNFEDDLEVIGKLLGKKQQQSAKPSSITVVFRDSDISPAPRVGGTNWLR